MNDGELLKRLMGKTHEGLHVAMPAKIDRYDATKSIADVLVFIPQRRGDGSTITTPIITEVPVMWQRAGDVSITFPLKAGDYGLVIFCDYDIGGWAVSLDEGAPQSLRRHNVTDAVFLPQAHGLKESSTLGVSVKNGLNEVLVTPQAVNITASTGTVNITAASINIAGNVAITGTMSINGKDFDTHTHSGVEPGIGNTGAPN